MKFSTAFTDPLISLLIFASLRQHLSIVIIVSEYLFVLVLIENTIMGLKVSTVGSPILKREEVNSLLSYYLLVVENN